MSGYFNHCLVRNNYNYKKAMNEFMGKNNTTSVPIGVKKTKSYVHLDSEIAVAKNLIEKYSVEYYLSKYPDIKPDKTQLYLYLYNIIDINYYEILLERFDGFGAKFTMDKPYLIERLKDNKCKVTIESLALLIQVGLLENK